jgi:hypothetical protein
MNITVVINPPQLYTVGLGDTECNDPLNDGIYSDKPYEARNTKPPHRTGEPIPQVRKLEEGRGYDLREPVEWLWYWAWRCRVGTSLSEMDGKNFYRSMMRSNAAFTNRCGSDKFHSFVLDTSLPGCMKSEGVVTPDNNLFLLTGEKTVKNGRSCCGIWALDYNWLTTLTVMQAKELAIGLPPWLWHIANTIHSDGTVTQWDYAFGYPLFASVGRAKIVNGFHCRENFLRASRLKL